MTVPKTNDRTYARKLLKALTQARDLVRKAGEEREKVTRDREAFLIRRAKKTKAEPVLTENEELDFELRDAQAEIAVKVAQIAVDQAEKAFETEIQQVALRALPKDVAQKVAEELKVPIYGGMGAGDPSDQIQPLDG